MTIRRYAPGGSGGGGGTPGALLAASNLSDVANPATARANLGAAANPTRIYLPVPRLDQTNSAVQLVTVGQLRGLRLDDAQNYHLGTAVDFPSDWATYNVAAHWVNYTTATGAVVLRYDYMTLGAGTVTTTNTASRPQVTLTAGTQWVLTESTIATGVAVDPTAPNLARLIRLGNDAADTLAGQIAVVALILTKAS